MDECAVRTTHGGGAGPPLPFRCPFTSATWSPKLHFYSIKTIFYSSFFCGYAHCARRCFFLFLRIYARGHVSFVHARAGRNSFVTFIVNSSAGWVKMEGQNSCRGTRAFLCSEKGTLIKMVLAARVKIYGRIYMITKNLI